MLGVFIDWHGDKRIKQFHLYITGVAVRQVACKKGIVGCIAKVTKEKEIKCCVYILNMSDDLYMKLSSI